MVDAQGGQLDQDTGSSEPQHRAIHVELGVPADQIMRAQRLRGESLDIGGAALEIEAHRPDAEPIQRDDVVVGGVDVQLGHAHPAGTELGAARPPDNSGRCPETSAVTTAPPSTPKPDMRDR